jgi:tryptophan-rich sensory protein
MHFLKTNQTPSRLPWWLYGTLFFTCVQVISIGLSALAARTRRAHPQPEPEIEVTPEDSKPPLKPPAATDTEAESFSASAAAFGEFSFYESLTQPRFAPPAPAFPVVWAINNFLAIWGLLHVLRMPQDKVGRREFLACQSVSWLCYVSFGALFFGLRSTLLGMVNTIIMLGATLATVNIALVRLRDTKAALSQVTLVPWLLLAGPTATLIALWNRDRLLQRGPFSQPPPRLAKSFQASQENEPKSDVND